jgi:GMC oxidoreductase
MAVAGHALHSIYDWNLTYAANPDVKNRTIEISQGKGVGGGSLLNRMVFDRGSVADYDRWETLGNPGWGWDGILPFFKKVVLDASFFPSSFLNGITLTRWRSQSEIFTPPNSETQAEYNITFNESVHGKDGYVQSSYSPFFWPSTSS